MMEQWHDNAPVTVTVTVTATATFCMQIMNYLPQHAAGRQLNAISDFRLAKETSRSLNKLPVI
jgi:hypothetical protein